MLQMKLPITAVIITHNEEHNIEDCLRSLEFCSEMVVVDSFSSDGTVEIAKRFTGKVVQRKWKGINDQREYAKGLARSEWVLDIDADERVSPELAGEIADLDLGGDIDGFFLPRAAYYLGRWIRHGGWYPDYKMRLYRRGKARFIDNDPHDTIEFSGRTATLKGQIHHHTYPRGISDQLRQIESFSTARAKLLKRRGRRFNIFQLTFRPVWKFFNTYILRAGFLDGLPGFIISALSAYHVFATWAKLWQLESKTASQPDSGDDTAQ